MKTQSTFNDPALPEKPISELAWEELLDRREVVNELKENLEAELKVLSEEFLLRLQEEKVNGKIVNNWAISKATRYGFDTTLEQAQELGAVKTVVDSAALKALHTKGILVPGVKKTEYVMVREVVKNNE